jgi:hypothetical protein
MAHLHGEQKKKLSVKLCSLRLMDCYRDGKFKSLREFADMGLPIKMNTWLCLSGVAKKAIRKYKKTDPLAESKREELRSFLLRLKKGSKKIRKILDFETVNNAQPTSLRIVESFAEIDFGTARKNAEHGSLDME